MITNAVLCLKMQTNSETIKFICSLLIPCRNLENFLAFSLNFFINLIYKLIFRFDLNLIKYNELIHLTDINKNGSQFTSICIQNVSIIYKPNTVSYHFKSSIKFPIKWCPCYVSYIIDILNRTYGLKII